MLGGYTVVPGHVEEPRGCSHHVRSRAALGGLACALLGCVGLALLGRTAQGGTRKVRAAAKTSSELQDLISEAPARQALRVAGGQKSRGGRRTAWVWQTAKAQAGPSHKRLPDATTHPEAKTKKPLIELKADEIGQRIEGFGGAFTEASAIVFGRLSAEQQQVVVDKYWGPGGVGYTLGRVHINSCDFSRHPYSFDEVDGDFKLEHFENDVGHDTKLLIPFVKRAQDELKRQGKTLKLLASPCSPPAWMKQNHNMIGSSPTCLQQYAQSSWAEYIAKWVTAYKRHGLDIWAITAQSGPERSAAGESCRFTAAQEAAFLAEHLGPAMRAAHPDTLIFAFDGGKDQLDAWATAVYEHPDASKYAAGIAFHWYGGDHFEHIQRAHDKFPKAILLPSEAAYEKSRRAEGAPLSDGDWRFGEGYAHDIIGDMNAGSTGWIDYNLILDSSGGPNHMNASNDAAIIVGSSARWLCHEYAAGQGEAWCRAAGVQGNWEYQFFGSESHCSGCPCCRRPWDDASSFQVEFHPQLQFIAHFAQHVPPGSRHLKVEVSNSPTRKDSNRPSGTCGKEDGLQATAFLRPDEKVVIVVLNCADAGFNFQIYDNGQTVIHWLPGRAIQTYLFSKPF